ncbi:MAG: response regulator [Spartobacteria bacterium]|nr:response regulator [Spartobacteria bacterium]
MHILIAEDDATSRILLTDMLEGAGHVVVATTNGEEAWRAMQEEDAPRLVLLDWMMPGLAGVDVCRRIRGHAFDRYVYVIMQTARGQEHDIAEGYDAGADDYLIKPLNYKELVFRIRAAERILDYDEQLARYAGAMQSLAEEQARQLVHADRMATLGVLSAGVAHEINNPTAFIAGNIQTMRRVWDVVVAALRDSVQVEANPKLSFAVEEFPKMIAGIRNGVDRITRIVDGLKCFAARGGRNKEPFSIQDAITEALELCRNRLKYSIEVNISLEESLAPVYGDKQQVEQVLVNLLVNAADAMKEMEHGQIYIDAERFDGMIQITVRDTGPGLPPDIADKVFNPFFSTKKVGEGTGLGLSISKGIIEEHNGTLMLLKTVEGAAFQFTLPCAEEAPAHE